MELIVNKMYTTLGLQYRTAADGTPYTNITTNDPDLCYPVIPLSVFPDNVAIFTTNGDQSTRIIVAHFFVPDDLPNYVWLSGPKYFRTVLDALEALGFDPSPVHSVSLYYHCQECHNDWKMNMPLVDLHNITQIYDAKPCPECGEPVNSGIYKIVIDNDYELPLYHGPLN